MGLFTAAFLVFACETRQLLKAPLLPKLRGHFAEFLSESSLGALGFSPRLPVSVCGTVTAVRQLEVLFLASNRNSLHPYGILFTSWSILHRIYLVHSIGLNPAYPSAGSS